MSLAPHPFSLRQLQYAVAVADSLSFRKAAEQCHVSQPSLSAQLAQLERALGVRLFERDRRRVTMTPPGRQLIARARELLQRTDELVEAARQAGDPLSGSLRIGVIPTVSPYLLPSASVALRKAYPRLAVIWIEDKTSVLLGNLESGDLDAAVLALEADIGDVAIDVIARDPFVLATAADNPIGAEKTPARPADIRNVSVLLLDEGHCFREQALAFRSGAGARELEFRATSLSTLTQMVAGGAGVTLLPELSVPTESRRARVRLRTFASPAPHRTLAIVWRRHSPLAPAFRKLAATLRKSYPGARRAR